MKKEYTTLREREYATNRKFAEILLGAEKGFFERYKTKEGIFTEQEVVNAIIESSDEPITKEFVMENISKYLGDERHGKSICLSDLAMLKKDTLRINHVRDEKGNKMYEAFTFSRDPAIS